MVWIKPWVLEYCRLTQKVYDAVFCRGEKLSSNEIRRYNYLLKPYSDFERIFPTLWQLPELDTELFDTFLTVERCRRELSDVAKK